jgi:hypothetical protein
MLRRPSRGFVLLVKHNSDLWGRSPTEGAGVLRKLKLLGVLLAMMAVLASSTVAPAMANHWDDDDDHRDRNDNCFMGYREEDRVVYKETIFGTTEPEVVTLKVPCDDDHDWDDDDHHWND